MVSIAERKLIVKLRRQKKSVSDISDMTGFKRSTVGFWVKRYNQSQSFENKFRSGRPSNFSLEKLASIKAKIIRKVISKNERYSSCNSKQLKDMICAEINKDISVRHARRILHKIGFSLITPRSKHSKNNPEIITKYRQEFKKNLNQNFWIIQ